MTFCGEGLVPGEWKNEKKSKKAIDGKKGGKRNE